MSKILDAVDGFSEEVGVKCLGVFLDDSMEQELRRQKENNFTLPVVRKEHLNYFKTNFKVFFFKCLAIILKYFYSKL